jgi:hypothetical protein
VLLRLDWRLALASPAQPAMLLKAHRRPIPAEAFASRFCFDQGELLRTGGGVA